MALVAALLAGGAHGMDAIERLRAESPIDTLTATPTNLAVTIKGQGGYYASYCPEIEGRKMPHGLAAGMVLTLTPDQEARLGEWHGLMIFSPVSFKDQRKGFRISILFDATSFGDGMLTCNVTYVALGDTLVPMDEGDVEMILTGDGKWRAFGAADKARLGPPVEAILRSIEANKRGGLASPPSPEKPPEPPPNAEPLSDTSAEDAQPEAQAEARTLWPYALIPPVLLVALWAARRRRRDSEN
jgi:hypothetical protein